MKPKKSICFFALFLICLNLLLPFTTDTSYANSPCRIGQGLPGIPIDQFIKM